ncbi:DUF350 domain-containing protein [Tenacibaculum finnmarkense genomovar ulcerans]|uniref:DUF350 domain-containing protein n=1 Tax=Tenacibaculum finnmarkense TaxID=2781243 RepID=UPI0018E99E53|nr:DUF350 domain-containing protein [Tenacibaculum finnmarkense]MCD8445876.1 DUF350 domain-containing protein [Tenacibaculum finnmarkense genomovar finnmarkense]MCD8452903.1 DUF350 domain-containing protein [Tenacibaculum finnmarkense genomovar ulcerans]
MNQYINEYINIIEIVHSLGYIISGFIIFILGKIAYKMLHPKINIQDELVEKDNFAFIISYVGYFAALIIVIGGAIIGETAGFITDILQIFSYGIIAILLLLLSAWISNKVILNKFDLKKEIITDQNEGAGVIEASIYIANGLVLYGALIGESETLIAGISTFIIYWILGNIVLILASKVFIAWMEYDIHNQIEKDNVAAGVSFSGAILAIGIITMNAILDPFLDWTTTLIDISLQTLLGCLLLPIMRLFADKILLTGRKLTDEIINQEKPNIGAGLMEAFAYIGAAILITWSI